MEELQIKLSLDEINLILESLGALPFVRVQQLIGNIQQQAQNQIQSIPTNSVVPNTTAQEE